MSIYEMHRLADDLTLAYHDKGLTFNQVFVLPQEIRNETLILNVQAGRLAEVNIMNGSLYEKDQLTEPFAPHLGEVIYEPNVKSVIQRLNQMPGLKVFGFYSVGRRQGETRLNIRVMQEEPYRTLFRVDNWGVQDTGATRLTVSHSQNNISGHADILQGYVMGTNESGNLFGGITYYAPWNDKTSILAGISSNQFEISGDLADFGLEGHLETLQFGSDTRLLAEEFAKASFSMNIGAKQSTVTSDEFKDVLEQKIEYLTLEPGVRLSVINPESKTSQGLYIAPVAGSVTNNEGTAVDDQYWALKLNYSMQHLWDVPLIKNQLTTINIFTFMTSNIIPDADRMVLTGGQAVRGYKPALFSADQSFRLVLEHGLTSWRPGAQIELTPFVFFDAVRGEQNDEFSNTAEFMASGLGLDFGYKSKATGRITLGFPLSERSSIPLSETDFKPIVFGYFGLQF